MLGIALMAATVLSFSEPLDDFSIGATSGRVDMFFGAMGSWANEPSTASFDLPPDPANGGRFLSADLKPAPGTNGCGLYFLLGWQYGQHIAYRDLRRYSDLRFRLRGRIAPGETLFVEVGDKRGRLTRVKISPPAEEWSERTVKLADFKGADLSAMSKVAFVLIPPTGSQQAEAARLDLADLVFLCTEPDPANPDQLLDLMERRACEFFGDMFHPTTGLVPDNASAPGSSSVAAIGFALGALPIAVKHGVLSPAEAVDRADRCLRTLLNAPQGEGPNTCGAHGFFYHFLGTETGLRDGPCELSSIDSALLLIGALTCGQYMARLPGGERVHQEADELYRRVDWPWFFDKNSRTFWMGWMPAEGPEPGRGASGHYAHWDYYTDEAMLICMLAVGSPSHPVGPECAWAWKREIGHYGTHTLVESWFGSLFAYFFCSLWIDLRDRTDRHPVMPVNWWDNAREAALANRDFCAAADPQGRPANADQFATYRNGRFGLSACVTMGDHPWEEHYFGDYGAPPCGNAVGRVNHDGTLSPYGAAMCLPLFHVSSHSELQDNPALKALWSFWTDCPRLWGEYGFREGVNLGRGKSPAEAWYASEYIDICQGPLLLGIENYRTGFVWQITSENPYIRAARDKLFNPPRAR
jgi:hypothetical protein